MGICACGRLRMQECVDMSVRATASRIELQTDFARAVSRCQQSGTQSGQSIPLKLEKNQMGCEACSRFLFIYYVFLVAHLSLCLRLECLFKTLLVGVLFTLSRRLPYKPESFSQMFHILGLKQRL